MLIINGRNDAYFILLSIFIVVQRENDGSTFGRHINLQLTYSFQNNNNNSHNSLHMNNNNNNVSSNCKPSIFTPHGKIIILPPKFSDFLLEIVFLNLSCFLCRFINGWTITRLQHSLHAEWGVNIPDGKCSKLPHNPQ